MVLDGTYRQWPPDGAGPAQHGEVVALRASPGEDYVPGNDSQAVGHRVASLLDSFTGRPGYRVRTGRVTETARQPWPHGLLRLG